MDTPKTPQRALITYRERSFEDKTLTFKRVIDLATDGPDAVKKFWRDPVWPSTTKKIEIMAVEWPAE